MKWLYLEDWKKLLQSERLDKMVISGRLAEIVTIREIG